jgi:hypothetical protein
MEKAPATAPALDAVAAALDAVAEIIGVDRESARTRQTVIMANAELRERELIKFASMSAALTDRLRRRGAGDTEASLAAETGIAVFRVAFERWINSSEEHDFRDVVRETLTQLRILAASG